VPRRVVALVELLLDVGSNLLLDVVLGESGGRTVYGILLHLLRHIGIFYDSPALRHGDSVKRKRKSKEKDQNSTLQLPWGEKPNNHPPRNTRGGLKRCGYIFLQEGKEAGWRQSGGEGQSYRAIT